MSKSYRSLPKTQTHMATKSINFEYAFDSISTVLHEPKSKISPKKPTIHSKAASLRSIKEKFKVSRAAGMSITNTGASITTATYRDCHRTIIKPKLFKMEETRKPLETLEIDPCSPCNKKYPLTASWQIKEFLERFDSVKSTLNPPLSSRGLQGIKLSRIHTKKFFLSKSRVSKEKINDDMEGGNLINCKSYHKAKLNN